MLDYVFFDEGIREKFVEFLRGRGVEVECGDEGGCIASIPEDLDDELADEIDHCYEQLLQETAELMEEGEHAMEKNVAGVTFQLSDGTPCTVRLDPDLVARILNCVTMEEFRDMVQLIATGVENPDNRPLCHT